MVKVAKGLNESKSMLYFAFKTMRVIIYMLIMRFWKRIASVIDFQKMYGWFGLNDHKRKVANGRTGGRKTENRVEFW